MLDPSDVDALLTVLRRHGVVQYCDGPVMVKLAPVLVPEAQPAAPDPFAEFRAAFDRVESLKGRQV